ncbi:VOC family protein [Arcanobacterium bovis]|uniref:VOC family protein n=1 Tax=Arcanobacterium bovis TaxID=2529275 RepID=A0A4Q9UZ06_9ACTO|nr:VOC family protein [Arcanobacterium bovis]TBW20963.1 VOC family protein [Arcanobacterium bovis]
MNDVLKAVKSFLTRGRNHGLNHVGVTVSDFEAAVKWYNDMFDFHLVNELRIEGETANKLASLYGTTGLSIRLGFLGTNSNAMLEIFEFTPKIEGQATNWQKNGYSHAAISVSNVAAWKRKLEARGVEFVTGVQYNNGTHWAFMKDPDGNLIELIDYHANRLILGCASNIVGRVMKKAQFGSYYM